MYKMELRQSKKKLSYFFTEKTGALMTKWMKAHAFENMEVHRDGKSVVFICGTDILKIPQTAICKEVVHHEGDFTE